MKLVSRIPCVLSIMLLGLLLVTACSGGDGPVLPQLVVGSISGPDRIADNTFPDYTIEAHGDDAITYEWEVTPAQCGYFTCSQKCKATLCPAPVSSETEVTISVTVSSLYNDPVTREKKIAITKCEPGTTGSLSVSPIMGSSQIQGGNWVTYGVEASGDTGVTYAWSVDPVDAGSFTHPSSKYTNFTAKFTDVDFSATIKVTVNSENSEPVVQVLPVTITVSGTSDGIGLTVNQISGPGSIYEMDTGCFSILASGDSGITCQWSVDPPHLGNFSTPDSPCSDFTANVLSNDYAQAMFGEIKVVVSSENCDPVERTRQIAILNLEPDIGWVDCPTEVLENDVVTYAIDVSQFPGLLQQDPMPLRWEVDPCYVGTFAVAIGNSGDPDYYISSNYEPEIEFRASEVPHDYDATISVLFNDELLESQEITILNQTNKPVDNPWYETNEIVGPTQVVEHITDAFYFSVPNGNPDWHYEWDAIIIDDWANDMPFFGDLFYPLGTFEPTRNDFGEWTWQTVEFIPENFEMESWILVAACIDTNPYDEEDEDEEYDLIYQFIVQVRTCPVVPIFISEIWMPLMWSNFDGGAPMPGPPPSIPGDASPEIPDFDQTRRVPYHEVPYLGINEVVRSFVTVDSYGSDWMFFEWSTEPEGAVHFWGDEPFLYSTPTNPYIEENWWYWGQIKDPADEYDLRRGSRYWLPCSSMDEVAWVEMTILTEEQFDLVLTVHPWHFEEAVRVMRFNGE